MNKICVLILLSMLLPVACSRVALSDSTVTTEKVISTPPLDRPSPSPNVQPLMWDEFKELAYLGALDHMYYNTSGAFDDINGSSWLIYRNETILPEGIEQIENNPLVPAELVQSLKNENDRIEKPSKYGGDGYLIESYPGDRDMSKFFDQAKRKFTKLDGTKKVAAFSRIGFSADHRKALVYTEYYSPKKNLIKCYFVMDMEIKSYEDSDFAVSPQNIKMIPVN